MGSDINPFLSTPFVSVWLRHFDTANTAVVEPALPGLSSVAHGRLPLRLNAGANHTKGVSHGTVAAEQALTSPHPLLVLDVPEYFEVPLPPPDHSRIGALRVPQYPGYLIDLGGFSDLEGYLQKQFSKSSRYKLKKYRKRFDAAFRTEYSMHTGDMDPNVYHALFDRFRALLEKRFEGKQISNNNLDDREWAFYREVARNLMKTRQAGLFVVYAEGQPVAVTLLYFYKTWVIDAITVFDTDFEKFHLGSVSIMGLIEWCLTHGKTVLDFTKGHFDYKTRWSTRQYPFEYRVYYRKGNAWSWSLAKATAGFYRLKQFLRDKGWNDRLHRLTYRMRSGTPAPTAPPFTWMEQEVEGQHTWKDIPLEDPARKALIPALFEFLYLEDETYAHVALQRSQQDPNAYRLQGKQHAKAFLIAPRP